MANGVQLPGIESIQALMPDLVRLGIQRLEHLRVSVIAGIDNLKQDVERCTVFVFDVSKQLIELDTRQALQQLRVGQGVDDADDMPPQMPGLADDPVNEASQPEV